MSRYNQLLTNICEGKVAGRKIRGQSRAAFLKNVQEENVDYIVL